jgi:hypothetical protein
LVRFLSFVTSEYASVSEPEEESIERSKPLLKEDVVDDEVDDALDVLYWLSSTFDIALSCAVPSNDERKHFEETKYWVL